LMLGTLALLIQPGGPRGPRQVIGAGVGILLLGLTHYYSMMITLAAIAGVVGAELVFDRGALRTRLPRLALALAPPLLLLLLITTWQLQDAVFRATSGGVLRSPIETPSILWYPVTLGMVGLFAVRGFLLWRRQSHPWRFIIVGWWAGVVLIATSTLLSGYHFVYGLHIPLCIAAAPGLRAWLDATRAAGTAGKLRKLAVAVLLFVSPFYITLRSLMEAPLHYPALPTAYVALFSDLRGLAPTRILAPPTLGNVIPALTPHRVWIGHWFMTPDYDRRYDWCLELARRPESQAEQLRALVLTQRFGALVVPADTVPSVLAILRPPTVAGTSYHGDLAVVRLRQSPPGQ
jgi:hypothetical protein